MKTKTFPVSIALAAISFLISAPLLKAASIAVSFSTPQSPFGGPLVNGLDGFDFVPTVDLIVSALGWYDHDGDGFAHSHPVGIYVTSTQSLVAPAVSVLGTSSFDITSNFRFESVAPFVLTAGTTYTLVGYGEGPTFDPYINDPTGGIDFGVGLDYVRMRSSTSTGLAFPTVAGEAGLVQDLYFGPNFQYTTVPEPCVAGLLSAGLLGAIGTRRRPSRT